GDGSRYPKYDHSLYLEWSRTTKGSGIKQFKIDSEKLIPGLRTTGEVSYFTEQALDFYGFNGYESYYNADYTDTENADYKSRVFYKNSRNLFRVSMGLQGEIIENKLKWFTGFEFYHHVIDTVDIKRLNDGKALEDQLPAINGGLYQDYLDWGLIPGDQAAGGNATLLKASLVYDTRDNEPNPMKGIWTELQFVLAPGFMGNGDYGYSRMILTHRQYFTLIPKTVNFAYRLSYQSKLSGEMPFYMLPFVFNTAPMETRDGLGGSKTMRGILRNRVVGEDFVYGNMELRWKVIRTVVLNQNLYIALAGFLDGGMVTGKYELPATTDPDAAAWFALNDEDKEALHLSYGAGLHFALNENFIVTVDYGLANDPRDGNSGMYIGLNFLF
ncbi:MAG: BamA/TamA family outer membrane protein, partial [Bacteroidales bacterium]|nr:BamA/TamA family outer membrane protein [Bacteroidales bacterium]